MAGEDDETAEERDDGESAPLDARPDEVELAEGQMEVDEDFVADDHIVDGDDDGDEKADEEESSDDAVEGGAAAATAPRRKPDEEEDDDDEDMLAPDDVEADLDRILKDRMVTADEQDELDDEDESDDAAPADRTEDSGRLQPKRSDEQLCNLCFLLVRTSAPGCPVGDDACPIFA